MKKPTKPTTSNKSQPPRNQRRAAGKSKPVTIDLKAEKVAESKPDTDSKNPAASPSRNGTPKVKKPAAATAAKATETSASQTAAPAKKNSTDDKKPVTGEQTNFGRNASSSNSKSPETKPKSSAPKQGSKKEAKPSSGRIGRFAAAVIGGGVALGGAGLLQYAGALPSLSETDTASLEKQVEAQTSTLRSELNSLTSRLAALESTSGQSLDSDDLAAQVDSLLNKRLEKLPQADGGVDLDTVITQVNETTLRVEKLLTDQQSNSKTLSELQSAISSGAAGGSAAVSALSLQVENLAGQNSRTIDELNQLKSQLAELASSSGSQSVALDAELENRLAGLERQADTLPKLSTALAEVESAIAANSQSLKQQGDSVEQLTASLNKPNSPEKLAARAVAAAALKNDIDRGLPFESSLQILQNLSGQDTALVSLAPYAQSGVPTTAQLSARFSDISDAIVAAAEPAPSDDLSSRLLAGVKSFVKVKPRKALEGSTPIAIVSRISQALQDGKLTDAANHWTALPAAGQQVSSTWHDQLQSRITANDLISNSVQSFLNSTATQ